jgi:hypothetical protein
MRKMDHFTEDGFNKEQMDYHELDPIIAKKISLHERVAEELNRSQINCEALPHGLHPFERKQYYSQNFSMAPDVLQIGD